MRIYLIIPLTLLALIQLPVSAQNDTIHESEVQPEVPAGEVSRSSLQIGEFGDYFMYEYKNYTPEQKITDELKNKIYGYDIIIVLGTWCSDSQREVPRFYKIMDKLQYNSNAITVYCVDRNKSAGDVDISWLNIERIPTFIFLKNGIEKGRIVESPQKTLEKDMLEILNK